MAKNPFQEKKAQAGPSGKNEEIAKLAFKFFSERGGDHGHDREDWLKAEAILKQKKN